MHNFINVYSAVKRHCEVEGFQENRDCMDTIAETANIPVNNLGFYLNLLQNLGLIAYSTNGTIELTETGVHKETLFA